MSNVYCLWTFRHFGAIVPWTEDSTEFAKAIEDICKANRAAEEALEIAKAPRFRSRLEEHYPGLWPNGAA
jgi:hypothetical protein